MMDRSDLGSSVSRGTPARCSRELRRRGAVERQLAGQHVLIDDRQAVLVALPGRLAFEQFRRRVGRRQPVDQRRAAFVDVLDQPEVADLQPVADEQQVLGLDVEVLERVLLVDVVEGVRRVAEQRRAAPRGECRLPLCRGTCGRGPAGCRRPAR